MVQSQADAKVALPQWGWWEDRDGRFRQDSVAVEHHDDGTWRRIAAVRFIHDGSLNSRLTVPESIPGHEAAGPAWITLWRGDVRKRTQEEPLRSFLFTGRQELIPVLIAARPMKMASNWSPDKMAGCERGCRGEQRALCRDPQKGVVIPSSTPIGSIPIAMTSWCVGRDKTSLLPSTLITSAIRSMAGFPPIGRGGRSKRNSRNRAWLTPSAVAAMHGLAAAAF